MLVKSFNWFAEKHVQKQESFDCHYRGDAPTVSISEDGVLFRVAPNLNHKTGFFLDQRSNRHQLAKLAANKTVLDLCCFTGGFAVSAAHAGATHVTAIDLDPDAIASMQVNAQLNNVSDRILGLSADVYTWLSDTQNSQTFDIVVLDPAKLTKSSERLEQALKQYTHMNTLAIQRVKPGGIFLSCSCSGLVNESDFIDCVRRAAIHTGRTVQIFALSGASDDHPYLSEALTGRYLKAVWARVF